MINRIIHTIKNEFKAFIYWCFIFTIFRLAFILLFADKSSFEISNIMQALYLGARISLKTIGIICFTSGIISTILPIVCKKLTVEKVQFFCHGLALTIFTFLFCARIPYYKQFNNAFDIMLINGMHDDKKAILDTAINQYQLLPRLLGWLVLSGLIIYTFKQFQKKFVLTANKEKQYSTTKNAIRLLAHIAFVAVFAIFCRYGGAFDYAHCVNWENAARLKSHLLNEAILDDGQALYRVISMHKRLKNVAKVEFSAAELANKLVTIGGKSGGHSINQALIKHTDKPLLSAQPKHVALVLGESFGIWPFLPEFQNLHLVDKTQAIMNSNHAVHVNTMLAHGNGTIASLNGFLTGLPNTGIYENYEKRMLSEAQPTGIGYQMKQLGYKTIFWYGGFSEWQNIKNIVLAQSFDEFHCADEFTYTGGNAWGCPDSVLYDEISKYMEKHKHEKIFHMILTVTNHPPYTLDVVKEGFQKDEIAKNLPSSISTSEASLMELGHMWYADKTTGEFVHKAEKILPDTLFILTGDHSERFNFAQEQSNFVKSGIPCIFYGQGIDQNLLKNVNVASHGEIAPTLMQLLAPQGTEYSSFYTSMFTPKTYAHNFAYVAFNNDKQEFLAHNKVTSQVQKQIEAARDIAAWRIVKGDNY